MNRLKSTFKRSYSPASSSSTEMESQDSLEVPKQVRSASFDDIEYRRKNKGSENFLKVPGVRNQRSKSFDSAASSSSSSSSSYAAKESDNLLEAPKLKTRRRASGSDKGSSVSCIHCLLWEEHVKEETSEGLLRHSRLSYSSSESLSPGESSDEDDGGADNNNDDDNNNNNDQDPSKVTTVDVVVVQHQSSLKLPPSILLAEPGCCESATFIGAEHNVGGITVILSPNSPNSENCPRFPVIAGDSIASCDSPDSPPSVGDSSEDSLLMAGGGGSTLGIGGTDGGAGEFASGGLGSPPLAGETVLSLKVPVLPKQQRSASVDSSFMKVNHHHMDGMGLSAEEASTYLEVPKAHRSRSVDIVLPTDEVDTYRALHRPQQPSIVSS